MHRFPLPALDSPTGRGTDHSSADGRVAVWKTRAFKGKAIGLSRHYDAHPATHEPGADSRRPILSRDPSEPVRTTYTCGSDKSLRASR